MKIYTKSGDNGTTMFVDGTRVIKSHPRIIAYGDIDELNSYIGVTRSHLSTIDSEFAKTLQEQLDIIQNNLFNIGSHLACESESMKKNLPSISADLETSLESWIDSAQAEMPELKNFILPGGHIAAASLHVCRTVSRRAERSSVALHQEVPIEATILNTLNRLSDYFFVASRYVNHKLNINDVHWDKTRV